MTIQESHSLNWDDLKFFLAVARTGTLRGAAESIEVNHTTLTRRLSVMEDRVGTRLFDRSKSGLVLTQLGEDLLPHAERVEAEMAAVSRAIVGRDAQPTGTVYVTLPHGLAMTSLMDDFTAFAALYPDITLNLNFTNDVRDLMRREADVSLRVADEVTDDVVGRRLVQMSQAAYCTRAYAERICNNGGEGLHFIGWHEPEEATTANWIKSSHYPKGNAETSGVRARAADHAGRVRAGDGLSGLQSGRPAPRSDPRPISKTAALPQHLVVAAPRSAQHRAGAAAGRFLGRACALKTGRILGFRN